MKKSRPALRNSFRMPGSRASGSYAFFTSLKNPRARKHTPAASAAAAAISRAGPTEASAVRFFSFFRGAFFIADIILYVQPERGGSNRLQKNIKNFSVPRNPAIHKQKGP